jgi:hypothetical protein
MFIRNTFKKHWLKHVVKTYNRLSSILLHVWDVEHPSSGVIVLVVMLLLIVYFINYHNEMFTFKLYVLTAVLLLLTPPSALHLDNAHDTCAEEVVACERRCGLIGDSYICRKCDT